MDALPVEVLLGIYLGLLAGIVPAFVAGTLGFLVRYFTGVTLPGFGVVVLALSIASINGGLLGLVEPSVSESPRLLAAVLVVLMLSLYAHSQGDRLAAEFPRRVSLHSLRKRTLSADVVESVGGIGQVTIRPVGGIRDVEGYPTLPPDLRERLRNDSWRFPADLPLSELEARLEDRLRTAYDLADVTATVDERGRAAIAAAPPSSGLSKRVPGGRRAVSVDALVPTGLARGDEVSLRTANGSVAGTVLSASADGETSTAEPSPEPDGDRAAERSGSEPPDERPARTGSAGGEGRVTVAVDPGEARTLLSADRPRVVVRSRGTSREFEALSLLRKAGRSVRRVTVGDGARGGPDRDGSARTAPGDGVRVLAVKRAGADARDRRRGWTVVPGDERLGPGDEAFVAGETGRVDEFVEGTSR